MRRLVWIWIATALALLATPVAALWIVSLRAAQIENRASAAWRQAGLPLEEFPSRFPPASDNASARRLRELAAPLGVTFARPGERVQLLSIDKELKSYLQARLHDGQLRACPATLAAFRRQHAGELEALVAHLQSAEAPRWEQDLARDVEAPLPSLFAHRQVNDLLAFEALERPAAAARILAGLWKLTSGVRCRPEMISMLISLALDRQTLALARRLESPPADLRAELDVLDYPAALWRSWQAEAWLYWHYAGRGGTLRALSDDKRKDYGPLARPFERRFVRLCAADQSRALAEETVRARALSPCVPPAVAAPARWSVVARTTMPTLERSWAIVLSAQLEVELTRKVLALRARRAPHGAWPAELPETASQVCPGASWRYTRDADGAISLAWGGSEPRAFLADLKFTAARR